MPHILQHIPEVMLQVSLKHQIKGCNFHVHVSSISYWIKIMVSELKTRWIYKKVKELVLVLK
jgi:hypothetical protein